MICFPSRCPGSGGDVKGEDGGSQSNRRTEEKRGFLETLWEISTNTLVWQPKSPIKYVEVGPKIIQYKPNIFQDKPNIIEYQR